MLHIITGAQNEGKTQIIQDLYQRLGNGDGIVSLKAFYRGCCVGYFARRLSNNDEAPLAMLSSTLPETWDEMYRLGRFSFSARGISFMVATIGEILSGPGKPVFIDEIGLLELSGRGFHPCLQRVFSPESDAYITVRNRYLKDVLAKYRPEQYTIIPAASLTHNNASAGVPACKGTR